MQVYMSSETITEPAVEVSEVRTVLVKDKHGNPIFLAIQQTDEHIYMITPSDPKFGELVEQLGITKRLAVHRSLK